MDLRLTLERDERHRAHVISLTATQRNRLRFVGPVREEFGMARRHSVEEVPGRRIVADVAISDDELDAANRVSGSHIVGNALAQLNARVFNALELPPVAIEMPHEVVMYINGRYLGHATDVQVTSDHRRTTISAEVPRTYDTIASAPARCVAGEFIPAGTLVTISPNGYAYNADGLYHSLPEHMREFTQEVREWEKEVHANVEGTWFAYADWCEEHGWPERARQLREQVQAG